MSDSRANRSKKPTMCSSDHGGDESSIDRAVLCLDIGVVKPHGRLGPLCSEVLADVPHAAYRRDGLSRPFRELEAPGKIHLGGSFPLRCIQRLSPPAIATRRCSWRHSRDTSGQFDPVLSY